MNLLVHPSPHGKRLRPLADDERDKMLRAGTARLLKGRIYVEVPPAEEPVVLRQEPVYATKVMQPESRAARRNRGGT